MFQTYKYIYVYISERIVGKWFLSFLFLQSYRLTTPPPLKVPHVDIIHRKRRHSRGITKINPLDSNNETYVYNFVIFILSSFYIRNVIPILVFIFLEITSQYLTTAIISFKLIQQSILTKTK